jgi:hypothetical protein
LQSKAILERVILVMLLSKIIHLPPESSSEYNNPNLLSREFWDPPLGLLLARLEINPPAV